MQSQNSQSAILEGQTGRIASISPNPWLSRTAKFGVFIAFCVICSGGLVTGNKAANSDPTWPAFLGSWFIKWETFVGGVRYEDSHRIMVGIIIALTSAILILSYVYNSRILIRGLAWGVLVTVLMQALIGGVIIRYIRPPLISMLHGFVAQLFFSLLVVLAVISSPRWMQERQEFAGIENDSFKTQSIVGTILIYVQIAFGTGVRHLEELFGLTLGLHLAGAALVFMAIAWLVMRIFREYKNVKPLYRGIIVAKLLLVFQILLGIASIYANRARREPEIPKMHHVIESTAHLACGSLLLATMLVLTLRAHRILKPDSLSAGVAQKAAA